MGDMEGYGTSNPLKIHLKITCYLPCLFKLLLFHLIQSKLHVIKNFYVSYYFIYKSLVLQFHALLLVFGMLFTTKTVNFLNKSKKLCYVGEKITLFINQRCDIHGEIGLNWSTERFHTSMDKNNIT